MEGCKSSEQLQAPYNLWFKDLVTFDKLIIIDII
jgi:hypothetical protein